ncbi:MAG: abortive infection family protein [Candidatus Cloacimonas sp.]
MSLRNEALTNAKAFRSLLESIATGGTEEDKDFDKFRTSLITSPYKQYIPEYVDTCRSISQFWQYIKYKFPTYKERREYIWGSFKNLLDAMENEIGYGATQSITQSIEEHGIEYVSSEWMKALDRRFDDPEAAITTARSLLETTCKHILDKIGVGYDDDLKLPKLYKLTAKNLRLSPDQHNEEIFKQILGGCSSVVIGLGSMRNKLSDSHGKKINQVKPSARHAALAVNLSGSMTTFLLETYEYRIHWESKST